MGDGVIVEVDEVGDVILEVGETGDGLVIPHVSRHVVVRRSGRG